MPHQCVRCSTLYDDGAHEILTGCSCGGKLFFFIKKAKLEESKDLIVQLTPKEKEEIEQDVFDLVGSEIDFERPVVLDLESIRILKPGTYELDLVRLFKNEPIIFKLEDGKYMIDLPMSFTKHRKRT